MLTTNNNSPAQYTNELKEPVIENPAQYALDTINVRMKEVQATADNAENNFMKNAFNCKAMVCLPYWFFSLHQSYQQCEEQQKLYYTPKEIEAIDELRTVLERFSESLTEIEKSQDYLAQLNLNGLFSAHKEKLLESHRAKTIGALETALDNKDIIRLRPTLLSIATILSASKTTPENNKTPGGKCMLSRPAQYTTLMTESTPASASPAAFALSAINTRMEELQTDTNALESAITSDIFFTQIMLITCVPCWPYLAYQAYQKCEQQRQIFCKANEQSAVDELRIILERAELSLSTAQSNIFNIFSFNKDKQIAAQAEKTVNALMNTLENPAVIQMKPTLESILKTVATTHHISVEEKSSVTLPPPK